MVLALRNPLLGFNALNDYVAEFYQRALERLIGLTCADSHDHDALGKLKDCMHNLGLWADGRTHAADLPLLQERRCPHSSRNGRVWMATEVAQILSARFIS